MSVIIFNINYIFLIEYRRHFVNDSRQRLVRVGSCSGVIPWQVGCLKSRHVWLIATVSLLSQAAWYCNSLAICSAVKTSCDYAGKNLAIQKTSFATNKYSVYFFSCCYLFLCVLIWSAPHLLSSIVLFRCCTLRYLLGNLWSCIIGDWTLNINIFRHINISKYRCYSIYLNICIRYVEILKPIYLHINTSIFYRLNNIEISINWYIQ